MKLTANFSKSEFEKSSTAIANNIDNTIPEKYMENLNKLAKTLQIIRDVYGKPIKVNSGYRCTQLNTLLKGAKNSDHRFAAAADITVGNPADNKVLFELIVKLAQTGKIKCRQIIDEYHYKWVHISVNHKDNTTKNNQVLHLS